MRGTSDWIAGRAKELRRSFTPPEARLWLRLRNSKIANAKFSRQIAIGDYIADFVCRGEKLIVEIDGSGHDGNYAQDVARLAFLEAAGYLVIRFTNAQVMNNLDWVLYEIGRVVEELRQ
jgi:very-short-patch-repair endonuclease